MTNSDSTVYVPEKTKTKWRVSVRYKALVIEECILTKTQKDAVIHFLYVVSRAMKRDNGKCPFYYEAEVVK